MDMPDMPVNVPIDNPDADTEWNDILRKHGIIPEKPKDPEPIIQEALLEAARKAHENRLEDKDLDELADLEDEEDEAFLEQYRQRRLAELSTLQKKSVYGQVYPLQKPDYARDVTDESSKAFVLVHLTSSLGTNVESRVLTEIWREAAVKYGDIKFCEIRADLCIEGYPERNTPTILIYKDGDIQKQLVTLAQLNGPRTNLRNIEQLLVEVGAVKENDMRLKRKDSDEDFSNSKNVADDDDDDDWD
ncbi:Proteolipid protein 2 [Exophiala xenobiotica]|nr:Proteolipid protein 2 [Exophiala xenobiotica]KAK5368643.1 Proteolipid protein 2 [Exophiala xenobiotica]KAK5401510.1 Proteolipid protein 2 [Exophiala xenobiotica]KAK5404328.1 Proteolipid protein 2 [Exophiala xenobiotica]KAK5425232.1 Proteolipid protein 2 [Exophiala xenobiotica]